ncbi:hypothetical protein ABZ671_19915 [Micromonospora sp. NPDC006766]|uniref:hypothetical protein n=1 Tax=Micromonospora sp. NPDC006766 TaxID=3154778 RepID=UPI00340A11DA
MAYLGVTNALTLLRLLPMSDSAKDAEILALRHQITVLERHLHGEKTRFAPTDRAFLAVSLARMPVAAVSRTVRICWYGALAMVGSSAVNSAAVSPRRVVRVVARLASSRRSGRVQR